MPSLDLMHAVLIIIALLVAFYSMARWGVQQSLAMPLAACALLALSPRNARGIIDAAFRDFGPVAILFTAVAVQAHIIQRSNAFKWLGAKIGERVGGLRLHRREHAIPILVFSMLVATFVAAALFHNITAIYVMVPITITICSQYEIPTRWLLSGELVASNLGGFSTPWGDTPNIIERTVWSLTNRHFLLEILPMNVVVLLLIGLVVIALTRRTLSATADPYSDAYAAVAQQKQRENTRIDGRLLTIGLTMLALFVILQSIDREIELAVAATVIGLAVLCERPNDRRATLQALDLDLYMVLGSIFVLARAVDASLIGATLMRFVQATGGTPLAISLSAYIGTTFTEAASWASATAHAVYMVNNGHAAAWSLGAGICAGSSSIVTAASAGLILWSESRRFKGHEVTFARYLAFGIPASLGMLALYILHFTFQF